MIICFQILPLLCAAFDWHMCIFVTHSLLTNWRRKPRNPVSCSGFSSLWSKEIDTQKLTLQHFMTVFHKLFYYMTTYIQSFVNIEAESSNSPKQCSKSSSVYLLQLLEKELWTRCVDWMTVLKKNHILITSISLLHVKSQSFKSNYTIHAYFLTYSILLSRT